MPTGIKKGNRSHGAEHGSYLLKVFKQVHPDASVSRDAMLVVDGIVADFQNRLIAKSLKTAANEGKSTLKAKHAKCATQALLSGELRSEGVAQGMKSLLKYSNAV